MLIWPSAAANPSQIMQKLSERTANFILRNLRQNLAYPWCQKMLKRFELPATVHHHAHYRVWNRRGYDMNIWSDKKQNEKIDYMHNNPVARGLVAHPGDWPWSSWRFYYRGGSFSSGDGPPALNSRSLRVARRRLRSHTYTAMYAPPVNLQGSCDQTMSAPPRDYTAKWLHAANNGFRVAELPFQVNLDTSRIHHCVRDVHVSFQISL